MSEIIRRTSITLIPLTQSGVPELTKKLEDRAFIVRSIQPNEVANLNDEQIETVFLLIKDADQPLPHFPDIGRPLLLISNKHEKELKSLESNFIPSLGLAKDASLATIVDALSVLMEMGFLASEQRQAATEATEGTIVEAPGAETAVAAEPIVDEPPKPKPTRAVLEEPSGALGKYLVSLKQRGPLGGALYATMFKIENPQIPSRHTLLTPLIEESLDGLGKWQREHIIRIANIAPMLAAPVINDEKMLDDIIVSALLMPKAIDKSRSALLRKDYTGRGSVLSRKELASLIKDSALQLASVVGGERISAMIAQTAKYVGREQALEDSPLAIAASALVAADCIDRVVFFSGFFSPEPAYRIIRGINSGKIKDFHPAISCNLLKFLAEAISIRKIHEHEREREPEAALTETESSIALHDLIPGMRLSRPLNSADGKALVDADVALDEDLIMRIWQLSTLKQIQPAVVVLH